MTCGMVRERYECILDIPGFIPRISPPVNPSYTYGTRLDFLLVSVGVVAFCHVASFDVLDDTGLRSYWYFSFKRRGAW